MLLQRLTRWRPDSWRAWHTPGANLTGTSSTTPELGAKQLQILEEMVSGLTRVAALVDASNPVYDVVEWGQLRTAAEQTGVQADRIDPRSAADLELALEALAASRVDAFTDAQNPLLLPVRSLFARLALQHRLPGMVAGRGYVVSGLLMSYTSNFPAVHRRAALYVDKILKGAKPADLPIEQPTTSTSSSM